MALFPRVILQASVNAFILCIRSLKQACKMLRIEKRNRFFPGRLGEIGEVEQIPDFTEAAHHRGFPDADHKGKHILALVGQDTEIPLQDIPVHESGSVKTVADGVLRSRKIRRNHLHSHLRRGHSPLYQSSLWPLNMKLSL